MENNENTNETSAPQRTSETAAPQMRRPYKRSFGSKRKVCRLCAERIKHVDYKQFHLIKPYCTETGRILPRKVTGACAKHQRQIARSIKINRNLAMLPYND